MKGFKDSTRMVTGQHRHVPASQFSTPLRRGFAQGGPVAGVHDPVHGLHEKGNVRDMHPYGQDHAAVLRHVPSTALEEEHGGKGPVSPGYAKGGKAEKHFHVHKHYHTGGKTTSSHKAYKKMEMQAESEFRGNPGRKGGFKTGGTVNKLKKGGHAGKQVGKGHVVKDIKPKAPDYKTGGTIDKKAAGGAMYKKGGECG